MATEAHGDQGNLHSEVRGADGWEIIPRNFHFNIRANRKRHWLADDVVKTVLIDGLSIFLPEGERFFIRSLKHYTPRLEDRALAAEINGYAVQEAFHTREHEEYNLAMKDLGYDVDLMEKPVGPSLGMVKIPLHRVLATCAIEHLTATFSTQTLRHPDVLDDAAPAYRRLWVWHALEELEHKAVAYDVLMAATKGMPGWKRYLMRVTAMNANIISFLYIFLRNVPIYLRTDGVKPGFRFWFRFFWLTMIAPGYWRRCLPMIAGYYLPWFNPRNSDDADLIRRGREWLEKELEGYSPTKQATV
jgi:uncharacterized protein